MTSAPTPTTGSTSQEVAERNQLPEQGGGGSDLYNKINETMDALVSLRNAASIREQRLIKKLRGVVAKIREERNKVLAWNEAIEALKEHPELKNHQL